MHNNKNDVIFYRHSSRKLGFISYCQLRLHFRNYSVLHIPYHSQCRWCCKWNSFIARFWGPWYLFIQVRPRFAQQRHLLRSRVLVKFKPINFDLHNHDFGPLLYKGRFIFISSNCLFFYNKGKWCYTIFELWYSPLIYYSSNSPASCDSECLSSSVYLYRDDL